MNAQLSMFDPPTLPDTPNATSSPGSASGASPSATPDGLTTDPSGQPLALANLSARQAKAAGLLTSGTCGRQSIGLSASVALQSSLANRLAATTASLGSTLYSLTWIKRVTPAGHSIPALRASGRPTSGSDFTGWATPTVAERERSPEIIAKLAQKRLEECGQTTVPLYCIEQAQLASWATPSARDHKDATDPATRNCTEERERHDQLPRQVHMAGWPTPVANDDNKTPEAHLRMKQRMGERDGSNSDRQAITSLQVMAQTVGPARLTASGELLTGSDAAMESGGQLNPAHSLWLQLGPFATAWALCAGRVTPLTRRRRKDSSAPSME